MAEETWYEYISVNKVFHDVSKLIFFALPKPVVLNLFSATPPLSNFPAFQVPMTLNKVCKECIYW